MSATQTITTTTIRRKKEKPTTVQADVRNAYKRNVQVARKTQASKRRVCPTCGRPL